MPKLYQFPQTPNWFVCKLNYSLSFPDRIHWITCQISLTITKRWSLCLISFHYGVLMETVHGANSSFTRRNSTPQPIISAQRHKTQRDTQMKSRTNISCTGNTMRYNLNVYQSFLHGVCSKRVKIAVTHFGYKKSVCISSQMKLFFISAISIYFLKVESNQLSECIVQSFVGVWAGNKQ